MCQFLETQVQLVRLIKSVILFHNLNIFRVNLEKLKAAGVPIYFTVQRPGDVIVTSGNHQVSNVRIKINVIKIFLTVLINS